MALEEGELLDQIYEFAIQLAKDAGGILLEAANSRMSGNAQANLSEQKANAVDLVTKTDLGT
jgi:hypothetical protein